MTQIEKAENLQAAIEFVNTLARACGKETIESFKLGHMCEDEDCFTRAVAEATGAGMVSYGETDDNGSWLCFWDVPDEVLAGCARAVGTEYELENANEFGSILLPPAVRKFTDDIFDGEYPELATD